MSWRTLALNKLVLDRAVKMLLLTTIVVVALSVSLWRQALHSKRSFGLALAAALLCALGLLALLAIAGRMPRGATPLDQKELVYGVLAASDDYALVKISKGLARVSLPQGRIERRYPVDPLGVVNQVAAHGDVVALVATVAAQDGGFERRLTLLSKEGFILEPGARRFPGTSHVGVSWSRQEERFLLTELKPQTPSELTVERLDVQGRSTGRQSHELPKFLSAMEGSCWVGDALHLQDLGGRTCRWAKGACEPMQPSKGLACPGAIQAYQATHELTEAGPRALLAPKDGSVINSKHLRVDKAGQWLRTAWITKPLKNVFVLDDRMVRVDYLNEQASRAYGHIDDEGMFELLDEEGALLARRFVARWIFAGVHIFESGRELVVLEMDLSNRVRLDARSLARLDPPPLVRSIRDRLGVWGGRSPLFEGALLLSLLLSALIWPLLLVFRGRTRLTPQRLLAAYLLIAAPTLTATCVRLFML